MRSYFYLFIALLLLHCPGADIRAQAPVRDAGQASSKTSRIAAITVSGTQKFPSVQIIAASGIKPGDTVTVEQLQGAANRLAALGIFSSVNYRFSPKADAISVEFQVQEAPAFPLSFDNFPWFTDEEIAQGVRQQVGLFNGTAPDGGMMIDEISAAIEHLLDSKSIKGNVTHQLLAQAVGEGMMMQFKLDVPGPKVESVQFGDPLANDSERLKDRIPDLKGQPYSRFAVEMFEYEQLRPLYASKGYLRAQIGPPQAKLTIDTDDPTKIGVDLLIPVTPGSVYSWNGVSWQGNSAIASTNLDGAVEMKPGDPVDGMKIDDLWRNIVAAYGSHGYLDARVDPRPQFDDDARRVSYRVTIVEGPQYHMGEIVVTGLSLDAEKRLRSQWLIPAGQTFDNTYFEKLAKELAKPSVGIFGEMPVHYTQFGHWLRPDAEKHTVDVLLDFK